MQSLAVSIKQEVDQFDNPGARVGYIGTPPAEVARALDQLNDALQVANNVAPLKCPGTECAEGVLFIEMTWDDLGEAFTAWEPWL